MHDHNTPQSLVYSIKMKYSPVTRFLRIFRSKSLQAVRKRGFPLFARLPPELRQHVWTLAIKHERHMLVCCHPPEEKAFNKMEENKPRYIPIVCGRPDSTITKVLLVNRESKEAVYRFYRVRMPCWYGSRGGVQEGILFFNPEMDTLQAYAHCGNALFPGDAFTNFVEDLRTNDPLNVGLINFAFEEPLRIPDDVCERWNEQVSHFRRVTLATYSPVSRISQASDWHSPEIGLSCPHAANSTSYDMLANCPRPAQDGLRKWYALKSDPRRMAQKWFDFLARSNIEPKSKVTYRLKITLISLRWPPPDLERMVGEPDNATCFLAHGHQQFKANMIPGKRAVRDGRFSWLKISPGGSIRVSDFSNRAVEPLPRQCSRAGRSIVCTRDLSRSKPELCLCRLVG